MSSQKAVDSQDEFLFDKYSELPVSYLSGLSEWAEFNFK